jgi:phenylacetate-coenzyme A ligase PaaK-like adenylate-forming protein
VYSDLVFLEFLNEDGISVDPGTPGRLVVTKLYGTGTPIIRYNAVNDIVAPRSESCGCDLSGALLQRIYGRNDLALYLPNGRVLLASSFSEIYSRVLYELKTTKLKETRVVQPMMNKVEIEVVIDPEQKGIGVSAESILSLLKHGFEEKVGSDVVVQIKEVKKLETGVPRIVSKVDTTTYKIREYI